jgi:hypothetical protein
MTQLQAYILTLACEVPVMLVLARGLSSMRVLVIAVTASSLTHPVAWHIASILSPDEYSAGIWIIEAGVVLAEALWYWLWLRPDFARSLRWSALANAASFGLGWLLLQA